MLKLLASSNDQDEVKLFCELRNGILNMQMSRDISGILLGQLLEQRLVGRQLIPMAQQQILYYILHGNRAPVVKNEIAETLQ